MPSPVTLLTPELSSKICGLIEEGNRSVVAAMACDVTQTAYETWVTKGNKGIEPYAGFVEAMGTARARAEVLMLRTSSRGDTKAGPDEAAGARFWITRARAKYWSEEKRISVEVEGQIAQFLSLLERRLPTNQYVDILTAWQSECDNGQASSGALEGPQRGNGENLLRAANVLDTEGEPTL